MNFAEIMLALSRERVGQSSANEALNRATHQGYARVRDTPFALIYSSGSYALVRELD